MLLLLTGIFVLSSSLAWSQEVMPDSDHVVIDVPASAQMAVQNDTIGSTALRPSEYSNRMATRWTLPSRAPTTATNPELTW